MPIFPQSCAMRLQHSRSATVMAYAGIAHTMIGVANKSSASSETPALISRPTIRNGSIGSSVV